MTKILKKIVLLGAVGCLFATAAQAQHTIVSVEQVRERMAGKKVLLVDVRSAEEYREGHIPGAVHIPAERIAEDRRKLPKDKAIPIIFYCRGVG